MWSYSVATVISKGPRGQHVVFNVLFRSCSIKDSFHLDKQRWQSLSPNVRTTLKLVMPQEHFYFFFFTASQQAIADWRQINTSHPEYKKQNNTSFLTKSTLAEWFHFVCLPTGVRCCAVPLAECKNRKATVKLRLVLRWQEHKHRAIATSPQPVFLAVKACKLFWCYVDVACSRHVSCMDK